MRFSSETFEGYLNDPTLADSERRSRLDGFVRSFRQTMMLARPLTGVSPSMIQAMHPGNSLTYEFSFGTIALGSGSQAATQIQSMLDADQELDNATVRRFTDALVERPPPTGSRSSARTRSTHPWSTVRSSTRCSDAGLGPRTQKSVTCGSGSARATSRAPSPWAPRSSVR